MLRHLMEPDYYESFQVTLRTQIIIKWLNIVTIYSQRLETPLSYLG